MEENTNHKILIHNETHGNDDIIKNPSSKDFLRNTLFNLYNKKNKDMKSKSHSSSKSKSKISISLSKLISFDERKVFGKLQIFKNEPKNKIKI